MKHLTSIGRVLPALLFLPLSACYATRPLATAVPPAETRVLAELTDSGTLVMGGMIGTGAIAIDALVASASATEWDLRLLRVTHRDGERVRWNKEVVRFPRSVLSDPSEKRLDTQRSLMLGGLVLLGAFVASELFPEGGGSGTIVVQPPPPAARIPLGIPFR